MKSSFIFFIVFVFSLGILADEKMPFRLHLVDKEDDKYTLQVENQTDSLINIEKIEGS